MRGKSSIFMGSFPYKIKYESNQSHLKGISCFIFHGFTQTRNISINMVTCACIISLHNPWATLKLLLHGNSSKRFKPASQTIAYLLNWFSHIGSPGALMLYPMQYHSSVLSYGIYNKLWNYPYIKAQKGFNTFWLPWSWTSGSLTLKY